MLYTKKIFKSKEYLNSNVRSYKVSKKYYIKF